MDTIVHDIICHLNLLCVAILSVYINPENLFSLTNNISVFTLNWNVFNMFSPDKKFVRLDGLYHEIFNEPEKLTVINEVIIFIEARLLPK